jgi:hypothetical protein
MTQEELIQYLKENLKIKVSRYTEMGYWGSNVLKVSLILDKHVIDCDTIYLDD